MPRKAHPASPAPAVDAQKPRPSESRKRPQRLRLPPPDPAKYPNLEAHKALERALHIQRAMAQGLGRKEAERHADEHVGTRGQAMLAPSVRPAKAAGAAGRRGKGRRRGAPGA